MDRRNALKLFGLGAIGATTSIVVGESQAKTKIEEPVPPFTGATHWYYSPVEGGEIDVKLESIPNSLSAPDGSAHLNINLGYGSSADGSLKFETNGNKEAMILTAGGLWYYRKGDWMVTYDKIKDTDNYRKWKEENGKLQKREST